MWSKQGYLRKKKPAFFIIFMLLSVLIVAMGAIAFPQASVGAAETKPYVIASLDRSVTVRKNKTLFITDVFQLVFRAETSTFVYRLPRDVRSEKVVGSKKYNTKYIAFLSDVSVMCNGLPGRNRTIEETETSDYMIVTAPENGKFSGKQTIAISYLYDIGLDRNRGFDDLTIPLTYSRYRPQKLHVSVSFPKSIDGAELTFFNSIEGDESRRTENGVEFSYTDSELTRSGNVVMQVDLGRGYYVYDSKWSKISGWYYFAFAAVLACIGTGVFLFVRKRCERNRQADTAADAGDLEISQLAVILLGFVPVLIAIAVYAVLSHIMLILPVFFCVFCGIGYFTSYIEWPGKKKTDGTQAKSPWFPPIMLFCVFFLLIYFLLMFMFCSFASKLDPFFLRFIAPVWAVISRLLLAPIMKKAGHGKKQAPRKTSAQGSLSDRVNALQSEEKKTKKKRTINSGKLFTVGGIAMAAAVASVFIVVALTMNNKAERYVDATGIVVDYRQGQSQDSDGTSHTYYYPVVQYEYEGITYTERSSSGSNSITYKVGETVDILVDPLIPSQFMLKADRSFVWIIISIVAMILYIILAMAVVVPVLNKKFPLYNWGGIFGSTIFIAFPTGLLFAIYFGMHAKGLADFIAKAPWALLFLAFAAFGIFGICYEGIRAIRLAWYRRIDKDKFNKLYEKEKKRFRTVKKVEQKIRRRK